MTIKEFSRIMSAFKNSPKLNDSIPNENWVKEVKLRAICSKVDKKERAPAIVLSSEGRARDEAVT